MPGRPRKNRIKGPSENNSQVSMSGRRMTCINCLEVAHNKSTYDKDSVPKTPIPRKTPGRKKQPKSVSYASSRGKGRGSREKGGGRGFKGAYTGRDGSCRGGDGVQSTQERQDEDYFNPNNFIVSKDEMDVDAMNKTPASNNLNVNTQESVVIHMLKDLVEATIADPFVDYEIINKSVVAEDGVVVSSSSEKSIGKKKAKEPELPFRIFHKKQR
ncbi:hypothetical protein Tco_0256948 [Tanacetum coccineum]